MHPLVKKIEEKYRKKALPQFNVGDSVKVHTKIIEGDKERVQIYSGVVIGKQGNGLSEMFVVSRVEFGYANEKVFPIHSPGITNVEVTKRGKVRKAKLSYLRGKLGKAAKVEGIFGLDAVAEVEPTEEAPQE